MIKRDRAKNVASLLINVTIFFLTFFAVGDTFRSDVLKNTGELLYATSYQILRYFTVQSNILVAIGAVITIIFNIKIIVSGEYKIPTWASMFKYAGTVAVTVTFITVVVFLGPIVASQGVSYFELFARHNFILHLLSPVLAIVTFLFFERSDDFKFVYTLFGVAPTVLYSFMYAPLVLTKVWPDFYGFTFGGKLWAVPISLIVMYGATFGLAVAERAIKRLIWKKLEKKEKA